MARWRGPAPNVEPEPEQLQVYLLADWSDAASWYDRLLTAGWRPDGVSAAEWRSWPEERRALSRWTGAWLLWHEGEDVDLVDAIRARVAAKRAALVLRA